MKLSKTDLKLLEELCTDHKINMDKVQKLLKIEEEHEFKDRRTGIYDSLREVIMSSAKEEN